MLFAKPQAKRFKATLGQRGLINLPEDLILEIICYLPLRLAIQCKCLNKSFRRLISHPNFAQQHASLSCTDLVLFSLSRDFDFNVNDERRPVFYIETYFKISPNTLVFKDDVSPYVYESTSVRSLGDFLVKMSSTNSGRILLQLFPTNYFCVLNPVTGAYFIVPEFPFMFGKPPPQIGLVDQVSSPHYKLVAVWFDGRSYEQLQVAIFESERNSWRQRQYETSYIGRRLTKYNRIDSWSFNNQPVYIHGRLHFARIDGTILVFDVNKESLGIIKNPDGVVGYCEENYQPYTMWFGVGGGSLVLAVAFAKRIVIYLPVPDNVKTKCKWRPKTTIQNIPIAIQDTLLVSPIYCDGDDSLLFLAEDGYACIYKIKGGILQKIRNPSMQIFHPFVPKLVDIPGCRYLKSTNEEIELKWGKGEGGKVYMDTQGLLNLQLLLRG